MKMAPMRFDGISLRHNPATLSVTGKNRLHEYRSPCCAADSSKLYRELYVISGEGEFYGADCIEQYEELLRLQTSGKRSKLVLPRMQPLYAFLKEVSVKAQPTEDVLSYRFTFVEAQSPRQGRRGAVSYVTVSQGESLWDIANMYDVPIEQLTENNPQIPYINSLDEGERVALC